LRSTFRQVADLDQQGFLRRWRRRGDGRRLGGFAAARTAFMPFTSQNTTQATIRNLIEVLMKAPYLMATSSSTWSPGLSGFSTHCSWAKSKPGQQQADRRHHHLVDQALTMSLNAAPMITPHGEIDDVPRAMNSRNPRRRLIG
jgi:hypothetical protein